MESRSGVLVLPRPSYFLARGLADGGVERVGSRPLSTWVPWKVAGTKPEGGRRERKKVQRWDRQVKCSRGTFPLQDAPLLEVGSSIAATLGLKLVHRRSRE